MGSVNSKVSEDEAYLDLACSCSGLSLACARLHLSSGQVQEDDHSRSWRVSRLPHPRCRLLWQERQVCRQVQESKESQVRNRFASSVTSVTNLKMAHVNLFRLNESF